MELQFAPGDPIIYVPQHAKGDITHRDCEHGTVQHIDLSTETAFCTFRYPSGELRTTANAEATPLSRLVPDRHPPESVPYLLREKADKAEVATDIEQRIIALRGRGRVALFTGSPLKATLVYTTDKEAARIAHVFLKRAEIDRPFRVVFIQDKP